MVDSDGRRSTYTQTLIVHQAGQVEDNEEGTSQDTEEDNTGQSEEIAEVEQSSSKESASTSIGAEREADVLFEDKHLSEKLSAGFSQFKKLVQR